MMWKQPEVVWVISLEERRNVEKPSWNSSVFVHNHENVISKYNSAGRIYLSSTRGSDGSVVSRRKFKNCLKREFFFFNCGHVGKVTALQGGGRCQISLPTWTQHGLKSVLHTIIHTVCEFLMLPCQTRRFKGGREHRSSTSTFPW